MSYWPDIDRDITPLRKCQHLYSVKYNIKGMNKQTNIPQPPKSKIARMI